MSALKKIGIMGGTFDPIHYGHLVTAEAAYYEYGLDRIYFIPSGQPPHKKDRHVTSSQDRLLMTHLATAANPHFYTSDLEIARHGYTYTVDTILQLHQMMPETEIYFITGADAFSEILTWKDPVTLLNSCDMVAATRPGYSRSKVIDQVETIMGSNASRLHFLEVPALAISSSDIRKRVHDNKPIRYLLPESVENYIYKHQLYR